MAKVAKNIKNFRTENKLTQDALAEKINVTRQTVSSWENGRTQPDIEMLELLSEVFSVGIEELIYGEKNKVGFEPAKSDNRKIIKVILASLGSLLTFIGLIIIFISVWDNIPVALLVVMMFLPLLAGAGIAAFAHAKRKDSVSWCEGASVAWSAGLVATVALVAGNFGVNVDFTFLLIACAIMILPMAFILKTLFPLIAYYICTLWWSDIAITENNDVHIWLVPSLILLLSGFICMMKIDKKDIRRKIAFYISILSCAEFIGFICAYFSEQPLFATVCFVLVFFVAVYSADKGGDFPYPFRFVAVPCISVLLTVFVFEIDIFKDGYACITFAEPLIWICIVMLSAGIYSGRKSFIKNPLKTIFVSCSTVAGVLLIVYTLTLPQNRTDPLSKDTTEFLFMIIAIAVSILLIIRGVQNAKMLIVNFGLVMLCAVAIALLIELNFDLIFNGFICSVMGIALLFINSRMSKTFKAKEGEKDA